METLILTYTKSSHTLEAASAVAEGSRAAGSRADEVMVRDLDAAALVSYDGLIGGSPCYYGLVASGIAGPMVKALRAPEPGSLNGKRCGGTAVQAAPGAERAVEPIGVILQKGRAEYLPSPIITAGVPMTWSRGSIWGPVPKGGFVPMAPSLYNSRRLQ
jgi:hypothetical protein